MNIAKKSIFKYVVTLICTLLMFTFAMPLKEMAEINSSAAYTTTPTKFSSQGGSYNYYNRNIKSYYKSVSWLSVTRTNTGNYKITVLPSNNLYTNMTFRTGFVYFKDSKGRILKKITVSQANPYLNFSASTVYIGPKSGEKSVTFTLSYNCPFDIRKSGKNVSITNTSGGTVGKGGSYRPHGTYNKVTLTVTSTSANIGTSSQNTYLDLYKQGTNKKAKRLTVKQNPMFKSSNTYTATNSKGGTIKIPFPEYDKRKTATISNLGIVVAGAYKGAGSFVFNSSKPSGGLFSGTVYAWRSKDEMEVDKYPVIEIGTFTISNDGTMTIKYSNNVTYTYILS